MPVSQLYPMQPSFGKNICFNKAQFMTWCTIQPNKKGQEQQQMLVMIFIILIREI